MREIDAGDGGTPLGKHPRKAAFSAAGIEHSLAGDIAQHRQMRRVQYVLAREICARANALGPAVSQSFPVGRAFKLAMSQPSVRSRSAGNRITSRIDGEPVIAITSRSMPMPSPAVGGIPCSSATRKSSSASSTSSSPAALRLRLLEQPLAAGRSGRSVPCRRCRPRGRT